MNKLKSIVKAMARHIVLLAMSVVFVTPLLWMVSTALKTNRQIFVFPPELIPSPAIWANFPDIFYYAPFHLYFRNTLFIVLLSVLGTTFSSAMVAYAFARLKAPGKEFLFIIVLATMMLPYMVWMIPLYVFFSRIGWVDTFYPLIVPAFFGNPLFIFLLRQFMMSLPSELEDAAKIDGCNYIGIFWGIILPLIKPALTTVALFTFMNTWNDFLGPLLYLQTTSKYTLAVGLQVFLSQHGADWALLMAASTLVISPVIIVFFFAQKQFIKGIVMSGIKG